MSRRSLYPAVVRNRENGVLVKVQLEQVSRPSPFDLRSHVSARYKGTPDYKFESSGGTPRSTSRDSVAARLKRNKNINIDSALSLTL